MKAVIKNIQGRELTLHLLEDFDLKEAMGNTYKGNVFAYVDLWKNGTTTEAQRKHYWAIIGDIMKATGYTKGTARLHTYSRYLFDNDKKDIISTASNKAKKEDMTLLIQACIDFCIDNDIPLNNDYSLYFGEKQLLGLTMQRKCVICGEPNAQIAHFDGTVGMGRNRNTIDHTQSKYLALCDTHHKQQHNMGEISFLHYYHMKPLTLNRQQLEELKVMR